MLVRGCCFGAQRVREKCVRDGLRLVDLLENEWQVGCMGSKKGTLRWMIIKGFME